MKRSLNRRPFAAPLAALIALLQMGAVAMVFNAATGSGASADDTPKTAAYRIVALGDSLTAGYGLKASDSFPIQLETALRAQGHAVTITNAGVSGDTSGDGLRRLDWSVPEGTNGVILELGANDALRGIDPDLTRQALDHILTRLAQRHIKVLLAGMKAPDNWGPEYKAKFDAIFPDLAKKHGVALYPFFLDGVVGQSALNQTDGLHPTVAGVAEIVRRILPAVAKLAGVGAQTKS